MPPQQPEPDNWRDHPETREEAPSGKGLPSLSPESNSKLTVNRSGEPVSGNHHKNDGGRDTSNPAPG
ncbi:MAG: hypothetical protein GWO24_31765 [Akkermansiaceae bacterium]|nr:hypothetical protein [Akkermansiaceae bacterium]